MTKVYNFFLILLLIILPFSANSHVSHYDNLNRIEFDIFRNNKNIGKHIFTFRRQDNQLYVESEINFQIKTSRNHKGNLLVLVQYCCWNQSPSQITFRKRFSKGFD